MRVIFHASRGDGALEAFASGVQAAGYTVAWLRPQHWVAADYDARATVVVVHGLHHGAGRAARWYRARHVPVWIVDLPRLRRELTAIGVYLNTLQWLPPVGVRAAKVAGIIPRDARVALVIGQKPDDNAHGMNSGTLEAWTRKTVELARAATSLPVVFRAHPLDKPVHPADRYGADELTVAPFPLERDFARSAVCITYNSTAGWDAIDAGVPVHALDPEASYRDYTTPLAEPRPLSPWLRAEALARCASSQWTMEELRNPDVLRQHLFAHHDASAPSHASVHAEVA